MSPLQSILKLLQNRLNSHLQTVEPRMEDWVVVSNIVDHEGRAYEPARDRMVVSLVGIQHETAVGALSRVASLGGGQYNVVPPPIYINLMVLFLANFYDRSYVDGTEIISRTIAYFQKNPVFTHESAPELHSELDKLTLEIVNLDISQTNYVMGMIGAKYLPAILYRARMIPFRSEAISEVIPGVV